MSEFQCPKPAQAVSQPLSLREQLSRSRAIGKDSPSPLSCSVDVNIGIFFDGTNNNKKRDQEDVKDPNARSHTNVVVLYDTFADIRKNHYRIYIPGVGTSFPEVGEPTESSAGKAMARGGEARIFWAMIQVMNAIHRAACNDARLVQDAEATQLVTGPSFLNAGGMLSLPDSRRRGAFHELGRRLKADLAKSRPRICQVKLSIFGFSRGAAEARTFCNWMLDLCDPGTTMFFGVPLRFMFLGLFDTVASVGLANSSPLPNDGGFMGWADGTMELPGGIERCVHYTAAHEIRKSFPLSTARKSQCVVEEFIYPGAHSDVGGGYAPGDQGKGKTRADLLSQVPLVHMYQTARAAGVPLADGKELDSIGRQITRKELEISPQLITRFNEYRSTGPGGGEIKKTMREHLRWYWRWRLAVGDKFESLSSFKAATAQDKEDLTASEMDFRRDLAQAARDEAAIKHRREHPVATAVNDAALATSTGGGASTVKNIPVLTDAEKIALADMRAKAAFHPVVTEFFDQHVHDSHASFYLAGPTTAYDRQQMIKAVALKQKEGKPLNGFERRVAELQKTQPGAYPKMTDADYKDLLEMDGFGNKVAVKWMGMSATRRESEGHVRERVIFDKS